MKNVLLPLVLSLLLLSPAHAAFDEKIKNLVDESVALAGAHDLDVPGVVVGVWDRKQGLNVTYATGVAEKEGSVALTTEHSFKIASVTKTMVCTVIVQLVEEGKLSFNMPVSVFFPDLLEADKVTIRMLGDMTSGYFDYLDDEKFLDSFDNTPNFKATPQEMIAVSMAHGMQYEPGTGFNYSNTNTVILGLIIEAITGNTLEQELNSRLYTPLGLTKTGAPSSGSYMPLPRANSYHPATGENWTDKMDYSPEYACGNAYSTLADLRIWVEALANGQLIKDKEQLFAKGKKFSGAEYYTYHFGIIEYGGYYGHSGDTDY